MRLFLLPLILLGCAAVLRAEEALRPATPEETALFQAAVKNTSQDIDHWAYTETTTTKIGVTKKPGGETVVRFDPSKPWPEQYTPLQVNGKPPTEKQIKEYRERGERRGRSITRRAAPAAAADPDAATVPAPSKPVTLGKKSEKSVTADTDHPRVVSEDSETIVFDVPLIDHGTGVPVEKIEIRALVAKAPRQVRRATMHIKDSFRLKLVAKVKAGEAAVDFTVVDPQYNPVMTAATGNFGASLLFVPLNGVFSSTRTDWKRVKPYSDRLQVKLGPLELLDF